MSTHTPGPWEVGIRRPYIVAVTRPEGRIQGPHIISAGETTGGNGWPDAGEGSPFDSKADAALIAAAPDLLALLKSAPFTLHPLNPNDSDGDCRCSGCEWVRAARAAVAKATAPE